MVFFFGVDWFAVILLILFGLALIFSAVENVIIWGIVIIILLLVKYLVLDIFVSPLVFKHEFIKCLLCFGMDILRLGVFVLFTYLYYQITYVENANSGFFSRLICSIFTLVYVGWTGGTFLVIDAGISAFHESATWTGEDIVAWNLEMLAKSTIVIVMTFGLAMFFNWLML